MIRNESLKNKEKMDNPSSIPNLTAPPLNGGSFARPEPQVDVLVIRNPPGNHTRSYSNGSSLSSVSESNLSLPTSLLLNVSTLGSDDDAGSSGGSSSNTSTLIGGPNCDQELKSCNNNKDPTSDINKSTNQKLRYAVMRKKSQASIENHDDNTLGLTVHLVKGGDEVDKGLSRPDPEGQMESSGNSASSPNQDDPEPNLTAIDITFSPAFKKLEVELQSAKEELQLKEKEVDKLSKIRDEVETELQDLTASLFQEAHRMVGEANEKRASTEKSLTEATMKIDGLETEVTALKALVLTSTPSRPNRHLHPQIETKSSHKKLSFSLSKNKSPAGSTSSLTNGSLVVGAGGISGVEPLNDSSTFNDENHSNFCSLGSGCDNSCGFFEEKNIDPNFRQQYLAWKKSPTLERSGSEFLERIYREDIDPCLNFPARDASLLDLVLNGIHDQTICITPLKADKNELVKDCPLLNSPRVLCKYHVRIADPSGDGGTKGKDFCISQLARNRITAVCNLLNYLCYIKKGLVKSHTNDVYWEIMQLRKRIVLAKLGFSPN